jgi:hypothetical protein
LPLFGRVKAPAIGTVLLQRDHVELTGARPPAERRNGGGSGLPTYGTDHVKAERKRRPACASKQTTNKHFAAADLDGVEAGAASGESQIRCRSIRPQLPAKLVIDAGADQVVGEGYRATSQATDP